MKGRYVEKQAPPSEDWRGLLFGIQEVVFFLKNIFIFLVKVFGSVIYTGVYLCYQSSNDAADKMGGNLNSA